MKIKGKNTINPNKDILTLGFELKGSIIIRHQYQRNEKIIEFSSK